MVLMKKPTVSPEIIDKVNLDYIIRIPTYLAVNIKDTIELYVGFVVYYPYITDKSDAQGTVFSKTYSISDAYHNGEYDIWYFVAEAGSVNHNYSEASTLQIKLGAKYSALATPSVPEARGGILDANTVANGKFTVSLPFNDFRREEDKNKNLQNAIKKIELSVRIFNKDNNDKDNPDDIKNIVISKLPEKIVIDIKEKDKFRKAKITYSVEYNQKIQGSGNLRQKYISDKVTVKYLEELKLPRPQIVESSSGWVALYRSKPEESIITRFQVSDKLPVKIDDELLISWNFIASYGGDEVKIVYQKSDIVFHVQKIPINNIIEYFLARSDADHAEAARLGLLELPGAHLIFNIDYKLRRNNIIIGESMPDSAFVRFYD